MATIVDGFISVLAFSVVALLLVLVGVASTEFEPGTCTSSTGVTTTCDVPTPATVGVWLLLAGIGFVAYFGVIFMFLIRPVGRSGQTIGRRMMNIRVVDIATGQPIGVGMAILRYLVAGFISGFFYIGYLWMLWDDQRQTLHDKVANSIVVNARR